MASADAAVTLAVALGGAILLVFGLWLIWWPLAPIATGLMMMAAAGASMRMGRR